jgi:tricorn protease
MYVSGLSLGLICLSSLAAAAAHAEANPHLFQSPALSRDLIAFGYAGDLWTVSRNGGRATRLTNGVGLESTPIFSPDGNTLAFTGANTTETPMCSRFRLRAAYRIA